MSNKKNLRRMEALVASQTLYHLYEYAYEYAAMAGYGKNIGKVIDKLVRAKALELRRRK